MVLHCYCFLTYLIDDVDVYSEHNVQFEGV